MRSQECQKCAAGTYSLGTGVAFDEWDSLPAGLVTHGSNMNFWDTHTNCSKLVSYTRSFAGFNHNSKVTIILVSRSLCDVVVGADVSPCLLVYCCLSSSTWIPRGDYIASNTDECTATLSYAVNLKKSGTVSFEYFYPDNNIYFEFFVSVL